MCQYGSPWRARSALSLKWLHIRKLQENPWWVGFRDAFTVLDDRGLLRWRTYHEIECAAFDILIDRSTLLPEEPVAYYLGAMMHCAVTSDDVTHWDYVDTVLFFLGEPNGEKAQRILSPAERASVQRWIADWRHANPQRRLMMERVARMWIHETDPAYVSPPDENPSELW